MMMSQAKLHNSSNAITMGLKKKGNDQCSPAVLYHYPCPDGAFAALAAHLYFKATSLFSPLFFTNTVYNPIRVQDLPLNEIGDLYLLDFVGPDGFIEEVSTKVQRVIILDHHKTALERLGNDDSLVKHSSVLDEFERARQLFLYVEDGDLWRWRLQNSKAFSSGLKDLNIEFDARKNPSLFDQLLSLDSNTIISRGMLSLSLKQNLIDDCLIKSYEIALGNGAFGHCLAVNADTTLSQLRSELGHQLAIKSKEMKLRGIGAVVYKVPELENDQLLKISLRSEKNEDTTPITQEFGGGGHRNAGSFMLTADKFEQWKLCIKNHDQG
ncbi:uncharacterized protein LOC106765373 isoform X3 [Vigna radiata var. radiata]|uniref:Uncharacterized protein LOC106765373 isoform X3 n=1 Tax=Vigna radiata var. radiata TaxID=3916 RepID=A0A3Q0F833_VIGRR|nr:uncharacterized protein LOC106765373 isoform X3 [Vigna radiata var. radiata]